jgi:hypothetical protein
MLMLSAAMLTINFMMSVASRSILLRVTMPSNVVLLFRPNVVRLSVVASWSRGKIE